MGAKKAHHVVGQGQLVGYTVDLQVCRVAATSISLPLENVLPDLALSSYGIQGDGLTA